MTATKHYLGGLISVKMWGYYDGYTAAQIELMMCDAPMIVYKKDKKNSKPTGASVQRAALQYMQDAKEGKNTIRLDMSKYRKNDKKE